MLLPYSDPQWQANHLIHSDEGDLRCRQCWNAIFRARNDKAYPGSQQPAIQAVAARFQTAGIVHCQWQSGRAIHQDGQTGSLGDRQLSTCTNFEAPCPTKKDGVGKSADQSARTPQSARTLRTNVYGRF